MIWGLWFTKKSEGGELLTNQVVATAGGTGLPLSTQGLVLRRKEKLKQLPCPPGRQPWREVTGGKVSCQSGLAEAPGFRRHL